MWDGINTTFNGLVLNNLLWDQLRSNAAGFEFFGNPKSSPPSEKQNRAKDRLCSFYEALNELRGALYLGTIVGEFRDETGRADHIRNEGWASDAAVDILLSGVADLDYGSDVRTRLVLIREDRLAAFIAKPKHFRTPKQPEDASRATKQDRASATNRGALLSGKRLAVVKAAEAIWGGPPPRDLETKAAATKIIARLKAANKPVPGDLGRMLRHLRRDYWKSET